MSVPASDNNMLEIQCKISSLELFTTSYRFTDMIGPKVSVLLSHATNTPRTQIVSPVYFENKNFREVDSAWLLNAASVRFFALTYTERLAAAVVLIRKEYFQASEYTSTIVDESCLSRFPDIYSYHNSDDLNFWNGTSEQRKMKVVPWSID